MKKLLVAGMAVAAMTAATAANAEPTCAEVVCVSVDEGGYVLLVDGPATNQDPLDGYLGVSSGGACASAQGSPGDEDGDNIPDEDDQDTTSAPTCAPS